MRSLTEEETTTFLEKLSKYIGRNASYLIDRSDEPRVFKLHKNRVYYVNYSSPIQFIPAFYSFKDKSINFTNSNSESLLKKSENVPRDKIATVGCCFGKFTKTGRFKLHITALDHLAGYSKSKIWLKPTAEMSFLYGNHILKAHVAKMSDSIALHEGVVVFSMTDIPLGFAVTAQSAAMCVKLDPTGIVAFHQADIGEYLRDEDTLII